MAYIATKTPGGKIPNRGWAPNIRGLEAYFATKTPGGKIPGAGWAPGLRGLNGVRKPVFGCPGNCTGCPQAKLGCRGRALGRLGQDDSLYTGLTPSGDVDTSWMNAGAAGGAAYGPSPSGSVAVYAPSSAGSSGPYASPADLAIMPSSPSLVSSSAIPVLNNPTSYVSPATGTTYVTTAASATSPLGGLSTTEILLGGLGLLGIVLLASKKR